MANATQTPQDRAMNAKAIGARSEAVKKLIAAHADEYGNILKAERVQRGLPEAAGGESTTAIQERLKKQLEKAEKLKAELAARGVTV